MGETEKDKVLEQIKERPIRMAICYDFDKTLSPDDMQAFTLIPSLEMDKSTFWTQSNDLAKENLMDNNLAWMYQLITLSKAKRKSIKREYFNEVGQSVPLYKGVVEWFERVNQYAAKKGIEVEHYIISSGLKEIIEGSKIAGEFKRIERYSLTALAKKLSGKKYAIAGPKFFKYKGEWLNDIRHRLGV